MRLSRDAMPSVLIATAVQVVVALTMASVQVSAPTIARSLDSSETGMATA